MEPRRDRPGWLPAEREPDGLPVPAAPSATAGWRRVVRSPQGAAGLAVLAAALLLWPFADWAVIPWLIGLAVLVVLHLVRLDGLLRGWAPHVSGVAVVVGLMYGTTPWAWAFAASIGLLLAGLVRLPRWKVVAVGAVLCLVTGAGFALSQYRTREAQDAEQAANNAQSTDLQGERSPERVPAALLEDIAQNDVVAFCGLLDIPARHQIMQVTGAADCPGSLVVLRGRAGSPTYQDLKTPVVQNGKTWTADACTTAWATTAIAGSALGRIDIRRSDPPGGTYFVSGFRSC